MTFIAGMKKVMVFGTFDGIHGGHRAFIREALSCGDYLIAVVAQDETCKQLKGASPRRNVEERCRDLRKEPGVSRVVEGDTELSVWKVLEKHRPQIVAIGYDQQPLKEGIEAYLKGLEWAPELRVMKFHTQV